LSVFLLQLIVFTEGLVLFMLVYRGRKFCYFWRFFWWWV